MEGVIEALHIYDEHNRPVLSHTYTGRPLSAAQLLPLYLQQAAAIASAPLASSTSSSRRALHQSPPALVYIPATPPASPPTLVFGLAPPGTNLLFLLATTSELEPLLALEFGHRVADALELFLGSPLLASKIEADNDIAAQLLTEMCDAGTVATTEGNALRDLVEPAEGVVGKLLSSIPLPSASSPLPSSLPASLGSSSFSSSAASAAAFPPLPWRRANVRHTSNELYADIVESLSVTLAPSGRPLAARAHGSIAFTTKVSGVPEILMSLGAPGGGGSSSSSSGRGFHGSSHASSISSLFSLPVFHPCVRLAHWRERPGELSFVPPDGRFVLAAYETDLLAGGTADFLQSSRGGSSSPSSSLRLPVSVDVRTGLGTVGTDFEVRVHVHRIFGSEASHQSSSGLGARHHVGTPAAPLLQDVHVTVPLPPGVRNLVEVQPSKGDAAYNPGDRLLSWHIPTKELTTGTAYFGLRCTAVGYGNVDEDSEEDDEDAGLSKRDDEFGFHAQYDEYQVSEAKNRKESKESKKPTASAVDAAARRKSRNARMLMPASASLSFSVKGWLASGIRVDSIVLDTKRSRGLGEGVKPFKGVKYLTISKGGIELRV